jgi:hypothetical protein
MSSSSVGTCDNLAFIGDHVIRRKHTVKAKRELPGLVTEIVQPLQAQRIAQNQKFLSYQETPRDPAPDICPSRAPAWVSDRRMGIAKAVRGSNLQTGMGMVTATSLAAATLTLVLASKLHF